MKRKGKIFIALLAVALLLCIAAVTLAACNKHEHLYSYDYDEEYHWQVCLDCGETTEKEAHVVEEWVTTKPATYDEDGEAKGECTVCRTTVKKTLTKLPLSPTDQESEKLFDLVYHKKDGNNPAYYSIGEYKGTATEVVIPSTYKDVPITEISFGNSWDNVKSLAVEDDNPTFQSYMGVLYEKGETTSLYFAPKALEGEIKILDGVTEIPREAFSGRVNVAEITIPDSVTSIGDAAFQGCTGLQTVNWNATKCTRAGSSSYPIFFGCAKLATVNFGDNVQTISSYTFYKCTGLTEITIPDSVTSIGFDAFEYCTGIKIATIPALAISYIPKDSLTTVTITKGDIGDSAFSGYANLQTVTICEGVTSIGESAFANRTSLQTVTVGEGVQSIGDYAFDGCTSLQTVTVGEGVQSIGDSAFSWCGLSEITIPNSVKSIGAKAFEHCYGLQTVTIGKGVTSIGHLAFSDCYGLKSVTLGEGVQSIGDFAFDGCPHISKVNVTSLKAWCEIEFEDDYANPLYYVNYIYKVYTAKLYLNDVEVKDNVDIPTGTTKIGNYAFYGLTGITSVTIPDSVQSIGSDAFDGCTGITKVDYLGDLKSWCEIECTSNPLTAGGKAKLYVNDVEVKDNVDIPTGTTKIGNYAFYGLTGITSVTIPDSVQSIGSDAFDGCTGITKVDYLGDLKSWCEIECTSNPLTAGGKAKLYVNDVEVKDNVDIPTGTTKIGNYAFYGLTGITSVTIPDSVQSIGDDAFYGCKGITSVTIPDSVQSIGDDAFYGCKGITKVNVASLKAWCEIEFSNNSANPLYVAYDSQIGKAKLYKLYVNDVEVKDDVSIPTGTTKIGKYAFYGLTGITSVTIPDSVQSIGDSAFYDCSDLQTVTIGEGVTSIGESAFRGCGLKEITIPNSVTSIGNYAFYHCPDLQTATINAQRIGELAFNNCTGLQTVTIGEEVTSIGSYAFGGCKILHTATINAKRIVSNAFSGCTGLQMVIIGKGVKIIDGYAFYGCTGLQTVYYEGTSDQWNSILESGGNDKLENAKRYYFSEQPNYDGNHWHWDEETHTPEVWAKQD